MNYLYNYKIIKEEILSLNNKTNLLVVTKNQSTDKIVNLIKAGHIHFAENKIQEAKNKWPNILRENKSVKLHLVGKLQSNKVKDAFDLFDVIHTLDNEKLAKKFNEIENKSNKKINFFIQVNIGDEEQKNGIKINLLEDFLYLCKHELNLNIIGLMCIPPKDLNPEFFFDKMKLLNKKNNLHELSMGMSSDYKLAIKYNSTYVRIGTAIFS